MDVSKDGQDIIDEHLIEAEMHNTQIFPAATNLTCTLTAHATANIWSDWAEIADSTPETPVTLSEAFAANAGHIAALAVEDCSEASKHYMFQVAYGAEKVPIGAWRIISGTNNLPVSQSPRCRGAEIPAGETLYYRAMCETAGAKTATVHIRYFLHT